MSRRAIANLGYGSQPAFSTDVVKFAPEMAVKSEIVSAEQGVKEIIINVDYISNIDINTVKEIAVRVEFKGEVLGQSLPVPVNQSSAPIKLNAVLNDITTSAEFMDELLSNPILFTVLDYTRQSSTSLPGGLTQVPVGDKKKKSTLSPTTETPSCRALGYCNLDIGDFVTGQEEIKTILLVEPDRRESPYEVRTWLKLPRLSVYAVTDTPLMSEQASKFNNTLGITIESIYNVPDYVTNGTNFEANLPLPFVGDRANKIRFPNGVTIYKDNFPYKKKWLSLCHSENAGLRSRHSWRFISISGFDVDEVRLLDFVCYPGNNTPALGRTTGRISQTYGDVFSSLPQNVNIAKEINTSRRVIRWNTWKNCLMMKNDSNYLYNKLLKYGVWPIEIFYPGKSKEFLSKDRSARGDKKTKRAHSSGSSRADHFIAFLNLSPLLHPGVRKARVAAQLFTYSQEDILSKFGMDFLSDFGLLSQSQQSLLGSKRKTSSVKSRSSVKVTEENVDSYGMAVFDESDNPTFIVVDAELLKPLMPHRSPESLEVDLRQILCLKEKLKPKTTTFGLMKENFSRTILNLITILNEEHKNYSVKFPKETNNDCAISFDFEKYLYTQENFCRIKASLEGTIIELIREKYGEANEEKMPEIYVYLVEEMHKVTNACLMAPNDVSNRGLCSDNLQLFAEEAFEDGDYKLAKEYILVKLSRNTSNPDYWLDYAVFCIKLRKFEEAIEAVKEALALEFYHQIGLLMYALLMAKFLNPPIAECAAEILLTKYPNFVEGWVALSLIYSTLNNSIGAQVALQEAKKLVSENSTQEKSVEMSETEHDKFTIKVHICQNKGAKYGVGSFLNASNAAEPLAWTTGFAAPTNFFVKTTVLLQKLGFYEYAALCLAEDLSSTPKEEKLPPQYVYYLSVNHYLQGRYEEAIPLLRSTVKEYGKDCFVWSLLGHCYYKLENHTEAIACYEFVKEAYNRPDDIHMIYSRLGYYYVQLNRSTCAKPLLLNACKYSPTPRTWKGVGLACLSSEEVEDAEIAFSEANYLDNTDPDTWAYLALTNALLKRQDLFRQCYLEAKKRHLKNVDLVNKIKMCLALNGLEDKEF